MLAAVDVGTNTVRLLVGEVLHGSITPVRVYRRITRLGGGFTPDIGLAPDASERTLEALREIATICDQAGVSRVRAVGTAALRSAPNAGAFVEKVRAETGLSLEIIEGTEEARLSALGVRSALDPNPADAFIVDIGGGSTEFVLAQGEDILFSGSYPLGVVSLCESFPETPDQTQRISAILDRLCHDVSSATTAESLPQGCVIVGTAGTVTTIAALKLRMSEYDPQRVNNLRLSRADLDGLSRELASLRVEEREALAGMEKGRGDLILPGIRIVTAVLDRFERDDLTVSDAGLLEGILLDLGRYR